jgi:uncharacterized protein YwqG
MYQNKLNELCEPAIWFRRQVGGKGSPSKLGGLPTLPPEIKWPRQQQSGTPLHFLAQIDLSRLPPISGVPSASGLPKSGMLFFFADIFCDMGVAQFWIEPADLAKGRFDRAWGTTEGG